MSYQISYYDPIFKRKKELETEARSIERFIELNNQLDTAKVHIKQEDNYSLQLKFKHGSENAEHRIQIPILTASDLTLIYNLCETILENRKPKIEND